MCDHMIIAGPVGFPCLSAVMRSSGDAQLQGVPPDTKNVPSQGTSKRTQSRLLPGGTIAVARPRGAFVHQAGVPNDLILG